MASFCLDLDSPLLPNVDIFINPTKDDDQHRSALNAVVLKIHRAGAGAFEGLVANHMGEYLSNPDAKVRERSTLLLAELLARLPKLPLSDASASRFATFFSSRLGDYPSVGPALKALTGLLKNHSTALLGGNGGEASAPSTSAAAGGGKVAAMHDGDKQATAAAKGAPAAVGTKGTAAEAIARGVFDELHLPALSQSIRQAALSVLLALVSEPGLREALSKGMGKAFVIGLVGSLEGEKDPRCLIVGLSALRKTQKGFDATVLAETSEAVFDATACYFPVTFTPPPNDPHNISPDALRTGLEGVLVGSPGMAPHVLPMLLDKLSSEVSTAKEASLKAIVAGVRAFGAPGVGMHLRAIGAAMFEEAVHGADPDLASLALLSLTEVAKETASHAVLTGLCEKSPEWMALVQPMLELAVSEVAGSQPCSVVGRGSSRVLLVLAASSALGLRSALALAVPRLLQARKQAAAAAAARKTGVAASGGGSTSGCCGGGSKSGGGGTNAGEVAGVAGGGGEGGGCCGGGGGDGGHADAVSSSAGSAADSEAFEDAQSARLGALAGLAAAVDDKVDFSGSQSGAPIEPFVAPLLAEFSAALDVCGGDGTPSSSCSSSSSPSSCLQSASATPWQLSPAAIATVGFAARGLSDVITRPPVPLVGENDVNAVVLRLVTALAAPGAWEGGGGEGEAGRGGAGVEEGTAAFAVLVALRSIGLRRTEYARAVLGTAVPPLLEQLQQLPQASEGDAVGTRESGSSSVAPSPGTLAENKRACAALVELSEIPGVLAVALSALLAATSSNTVGGEGEAATNSSPGCSLIAEVALRALDDVLKRGVKWGHHGDEILAFIRGDAPARATDVAPASTAAPPAKASATTENLGPWGLPRLLGVLDSASPSFSRQGRLAGSDPSRDVRTNPNEDATVAAGGGADHPSPSAWSLSFGALGAAVSAVRTCTQAAPPDEQEALLSSLLSQVLPPSVASAAGHGTSLSEGESDSRKKAAVGGRIEQHAALLPALAAVMGAVSLGSRALEKGGAAAAAVPALLSAALAEGAEGLVEGGGGWRRGTGVRTSGIAGGGIAGAAPCCQCLAAVLNKLAAGPELDSAVGLVVGALTEAFSDAGGKDEGEAMDVEGEGGGEGRDGMGPVQCLAWTVKAVAMRGGLGGVFSSLLDLLCGLLLNTSTAEEERPRSRALAAAAAFGIALGDEGEALTTDTDWSGGGARVSPLWRQRFFVQAFPKLLAASRGPPAIPTGAQAAQGSGSLDDDADTSSGGGGGDSVSGVGQEATCRKRSANARVPALLALLGVVRGVPREALSQHLDTVVATVVQALRSDYPPLQVDALETFKVRSKDDLAAFSPHLSSVIPLLLSLAEGGTSSSDSGASGGSKGVGGRGAMGRFRAVQCLTTLTALPYSRLHPFKTQVTRRLRGPLDDDRRAVRQAAVEARNIWFLLG